MKWLLGGGGLGLLFLGWWLLSPLWIDRTLVEELPEGFATPIEAPESSIPETPVQAEEVVPAPPITEPESIREETPVREEVDFPEIETEFEPIDLQETETEPEVEIFREIQPVVTPVPVEQPKAPVVRWSGDFTPVDYEVQGSFRVLENASGQQLLRIENLDIENGPDLFLVASNQRPKLGNKDYEIIAPLKANKGSWQVEVPSEVSLGDYRYLLIHCRAFSHTFAGAEIIENNNEEQKGGVLAE